MHKLYLVTAGEKEREYTTFSIHYDFTKARRKASRLANMLYQEPLTRMDDWFWTNEDGEYVRIRYIMCYDKIPPEIIKENS